MSDGLIWFGGFGLVILLTLVAAMVDAALQRWWAGRRTQREAGKAFARKADRDATGRLWK